MGIDLDLSLSSDAGKGVSTPKLSLTATPPALTTLNSGVAKSVTVPISAAAALNITGIVSSTTDATITSPSLPLAIAANGTGNIVISLNSTTAGQHNLILTVTGTEGGVTLHRNIYVHYVVAPDTHKFVENNGAQIVNNHKTVIND